MEMSEKTMEKYMQGNDLHLMVKSDVLNIADTLDCGQCFRFKIDSDNGFHGVAFGKYLKIMQTDDEVIFINTTATDFDEIWYSYFDFTNDYDSIKKTLSFDETIQKAIEFAGGIRILKQDKFEALCSFIISQNNNIPRIKGSIEKLSVRFGTKLQDGIYTFPTIEQLNDVKKEDLQELSLGYRDDYIVDCVQKISSGELSLDEVVTMDIVSAREKLRTIKGVGPKVCECALLFGFHRLEAFPIDTWIKKVLAAFYKDGFPKQANEWAGIAQQYLFHYIRRSGVEF